MFTATVFSNFKMGEHRLKHLFRECQRQTRTMPKQHFNKQWTHNIWQLLSPESPYKHYFARRRSGQAAHSYCRQTHSCLNIHHGTLRGYHSDLRHDDVIKWKYFPRYWSFVQGIHQPQVNSSTKASDAELWCFLWSVQTDEQIMETQVIWDAIALIMTSW